MPYQSAARFLVLHAVRLKGVAEVPALCRASDLAAGEVETGLAGLAADGLVERRPGPLSGWAPTALGRKHDDVEVAEELEASGARPLVEAAYQSFLGLNPKLLEVCTAWQLRRTEGDDSGDGSGGGEPDARPIVNDHTDPAYDAAVVARLVEVHRRAQPLLAGLAGALARFAPYGPRLAHALAQVQAGEGDWFTRPLLDSYHSVWFELHQDLLDTLGLDRGATDASVT